MISDPAAIDPAEPLETVVVTAELYRRTSRPANYEAVNRALIALAAEMANSPQSILLKLVETVLQLCQAHSAGISVLEEENGREVFRWLAVAGPFAVHCGETIPRDLSPCGAVLDRDSVQLMAYPDRHFTVIAQIAPRITEALLQPFYVGGKSRGTIWAIAHDERRRFDVEDARVMKDLAEFAGAAYQVQSSLDALDEAGNVLRQSEARLRIALANSDTGTFRWNPCTGEFSEFDENLKRLFGLAPDQPVRTTEDFITRVHPDDLPALLPAIHRSSQGADFEMEYRIVLPDGGVRWLYDRAKMERDAEGRPAHLVGACTDITNRKQTERLLAEKNREDDERRMHEVEIDRQRLADVLRHAPSVMCLVTGPEHVFEMANERYYELTGRRDILGKRARDVFPEKEHERLFEVLDRVYRTGKAFVGADVPVILHRRAGLPLGDRRFNFVYQPLRDANDAVTGILVQGVDLTERKRAEEALRASERRWRDLTEALPNLVWSDLPDGQCDWLSSQWRKFTGILEQELLGLAWLEKVVHPDDRERTRRCWQAACAGEADYDVEYRIRRYDGEYHWFKTRGVPIRDERGQVVNWFGTCTDIEDFKRLEAALTEADRRKDEFLATLAHELRNPLAPVRNSLEILRLSGGSEPAAGALHEIMERQIEHLSRLVDDLMEVSRITRGKIELRQAPVELAAVVRGAIETSRPLIESARHRLDIALPAEPLWLDADPLRLAQVLANLLNNAAKYTDEGGQIWLTARREQDEAVVSVRDSGMGIPAEMLPKVFDMFSQVDRHLHRAQGGLGIGLALVSELVRLHGGRVEAHSEGPGKGSEFTIRLPLAPARRAAADAVRRGEAPPPSELSSLRVLVVDDNRDAADSLAMLLKVLGANSRAIYDGASALEAARDYRPMAVLLDLGMPGVDGYEVARRIRQDPEVGGVVLIALTGWGQEEDRLRTQAARFDHHLVKPVDHAALTKLLAEFAPKRPADGPTLLKRLEPLAQRHGGDF